MTGHILANLGHVTFVRGDLERAGQLFFESLILRHGIRDTFGIAQSLDGATAPFVAAPARRAARRLGHPRHHGASRAGLDQ